MSRVDPGVKKNYTSSMHYGLLMQRILVENRERAPAEFQVVAGVDDRCRCVANQSLCRIGLQHVLFMGLRIVMVSLDEVYRRWTELENIAPNSWTNLK